MAYMKIVDKFFLITLEWGYPQTRQPLSTELSPSHMYMRNFSFIL